VKYLPVKKNSKQKKEHCTTKTFKSWKNGRTSCATRRESTTINT
jgi:hypothetical protein